MASSRDGLAPGCRLEFIDSSPGLGRRHVFYRSKDRVRINMDVSSVALSGFSIQKQLESTMCVGVVACGFMSHYDERL